MALPAFSGTLTPEESVDNVFSYWADLCAAPSASTVRSIP